MGYSEADLVFRIGYPFRQMAKFENKENDIVVEVNDFKMEVKYLERRKAKAKAKLIEINHKVGSKSKKISTGLRRKLKTKTLRVNGHLLLAGLIPLKVFHAKYH